MAVRAHELALVDLGEDPFATGSRGGSQPSAELVQAEETPSADTCPRRLRRLELRLQRHKLVGPLAGDVLGKRPGAAERRFGLSHDLGSRSSGPSVPIGGAVILGP